MKRPLATLLFATLALGACDKAADKGATPASSAGAAAAAATATVSASGSSNEAATAALNASEPPLPDLGQFQIVSVLLGNGVDAEHVVLADTRALAAQQPIYASVLSVGAHQGLKISADWIAPDGHSFAKSEQSVVPDSDLATTFKVENPAGWPAGDYQVRIALNGHTVRTESFTVQ